MLANLLCQFEVHLVIGNIPKETQCVSYLINVHLICFII